MTNIENQAARRVNPLAHDGDDAASKVLKPEQAEETGNGGATASTYQSPENNTGIGGQILEPIAEGQIEADVDAPSG